ncbi:MAG: MFS transporter [Candidatus Thorarchaeota archaeon]
MSTEKKFTPDFNAMINIVMFNSIGFFFLEYLIPVVASIIIGASGLQIGLLFSVQVIGYIISSFFTGFITDKTKSKTRLILLGSYGRGTAYFILYTALIFNSLIGIGVGTFSIGFFAGFFWIPFDTLIAEKSRKNNRSEAYGKRDAAMGRGTVLGAFIGFSIFGFASGYTNNPFLIYIAILFFGISNFYGGYKFHKNVDESIKIPIQEENKILKEKNTLNSSKILGTFTFGLLFLAIVLLLANINGSLARPFINVYIVNEIINDATLAMFVYAPSGAISLFLSPKIGRYVDKLHPSIGITISSIFGSLVTWVLINIDNAFLFAALLTLDLTIITIGNLAFQNFLSRVTIKHRGKIMGFRIVMVNIGTVIGPIIGGIVLDMMGLKAPFIISIFVELSLIPFYILSVYLMKGHLTEKYEIREKIEVERI